MAQAKKVIRRRREKKNIERGQEIGRASCRERVFGYV